MTAAPDVSALRMLRQALAHRPTRRILLFGWLVPACAIAPEALAAPYATHIGQPARAAGFLLMGIPIGTVAADVGLTGSELPEQINGNAPLLARLEEIRRILGGTRGARDVERSFGGIRITVGKFTSPLKNNVSGLGIAPNIVVIDTANYTALHAAINEVRILLGKPAVMPMSPDMMMNPMQ